MIFTTIMIACHPRYNLYRVFCITYTVLHMKFQICVLDGAVAQSGHEAVAHPDTIDLSLIHI